MALTYTAIATVVVGSGGASTIQFTSIPGTYTDLCVKLSARTNWTAEQSYDNLIVRFNGSSNAAYSSRLLYGTGSGSGGSLSTASGTSVDWTYANTNSTTANAFSNSEYYITNYAGSTNKVLSVDIVTETNRADNVLAGMTAGLWADTSAITSISFTLNDGRIFQQYSTATLYGIKNTV